jgi:glycosyltransferase involved in cell wall biosynthesis
MKIMIGAVNYPKLSESYIEAEIRFLGRIGIDVAVHSTIVGSPGTPELVPVFRGPVQEAISSWRPDVFHAHYLTFSPGVLAQVAAAGIPVTVRGHSFDFGVALAREVADRPYVKRVWLFPHFARLSAHPKVHELPVAYDSTLYVPSITQKDRTLVYRTGAGKGGKGFPDFFEAARLCPGHRFSMTANRVIDAESYRMVLRGLASGTSVEYVEDIQRDEAVRRMSRAGIYLDTSDPKGHLFGMPISIAEAMATGAFVLARRAPSIESYLGGAGGVYDSPAEAAAMIRQTETWSPERWADVGWQAVAQAQQFRDEAVLPAEVDFWRGLP